MTPVSHQPLPHANVNDHVLPAPLRMAAYQQCELCPRRCHTNRNDGMPGSCGMLATPRIARAALHPWEEPPISGTNGSGTIFFVGCSLACVYCQNADISQPGTTATHGIPGRPVDIHRLAEICLELEAQGAHNINLVTATHHAPHVAAAIAAARTAGLSIPVVYNTSGYERTELVTALAGTVDVWLTDFKYADANRARTHSHAGDYPSVAAAALTQMVANLRLAGGRAIDDNGIMQRGIIVRHLLLPGAVDNAEAVLDTVYELCGTHDVDVSVMNQYTPTAAARNLGAPLDRPVTEDEYEHVLTYADDLDFEHLWWQQGGTVAESFIPSWDNSGV